METGMYRVKVGKRRQGVSLRSVFIRYLFGSGTFGVTFLVGAFFLMLILQNMGFLYRANAGAQACYRAIPLVREMTAADFAPEVVSAPCRYVILEKEEPDAAVLRTNMEEKQIEIARDAMRGIRRKLIYARFHETVPLKDGAVCLLQFDYEVAYVNPKLQSGLPDFQITYFLAAGMMVLAGLAWITGHYARLILRETRLLVSAGEALARQQGREAETVCSKAKAADIGDREGKATVREFRAALENMEALRREAEAALEQKWRAEQEKREGIAALAHDLKTPLTVIGGNAELLLEEAPEGEQRLCAEMILRNVEYARGYVDRLRWIVFMQDMEEETMQILFLPDFYAECCREGKMLCGQKQIRLRDVAVPALSFPARREELRRTLLNMLDNAVRFTPEGKEILFTAGQEEEYLQFTVSDDGPGFSREALRRAGQMFYTTDSARTRAGHQGLGLYFARRTARRHGGEMTVGNTETGARVCLRILLQTERGKGKSGPEGTGK